VLGTLTLIKLKYFFILVDGFRNVCNKRFLTFLSKCAYA